MINKTTRGIFTALAFMAVTAFAQTSTTEKIAGKATTTTSQQTGTVVLVDGNTVVVKMSTGAVRTVTVPDSRTAMIDGKEVTVHDLKPGTKLTATLVTTTTPVTERTITTGTGTVWFVSGNTVILTMADGKNKMFKVKPDFKFTVDGQPASASDLRKGMRVSGEKIVEEPLTEIASNTTVTGTAPKPVVAAAPPPPAPVRKEAAPAPPPLAPVAAAPAPAPAPEPAPVAAPAPVPATLPKTGSPLPLGGMLGLLFTGAGLGLRKLRRQ